MVHTCIRAIIYAACLISATAFASPELVRAKNCVACHHLERKMAGPAFQAIAAKYANDEAATKTLIEKVMKGGVGVWGQMPMPAQANVSPDEAEAIVKWILERKP
jgi:cytochrome c